MAVINEIKASLISQYLGRIDAEFYKPTSLSADFKIKSGRFKYLGQIVKNGYRVVYENTKILPDSQVNKDRDARFLQATNISSDGLWIEVDDIGWVHEKDWKRYPKGRIEMGEILIEVKGSAEKVTIVQDYVPLRTLVTGSVFKLSLIDESVSHDYLFAFFNSSYGKVLRDRTKVNTLISYVSKPELYRIPIFIPNRHDHDEVSDLIRNAFKSQKLSKELYFNANQLLEQALGLDKLKFEKPKSYTASFSEIVQRLRTDADYFQTKYRQLELHMNGFKTSTLSSLCDFTKGVEVGSKAYVDDGRLFIRVSNIDPMEIKTTNSDKYISEVVCRNFKFLKPRKGDILITKDGTIGIAHVVDNELDGIISSGIFKLTLKDNSVPVEYLALVINSPFCRMQAERDCSGALILHWKPEDIKKLKIPILDSKLMEELADMVIRSKEARKKSQELLNTAKQRVEQLIEEAAAKHE